MANMYYSNTIGINKRIQAMPKPIPFRYVGPDKLNNFHASKDAHRRYVSETFRAGDRNHKVPTTSSPIMMTSGVSPAHFINDHARTK